MSKPIVSAGGEWKLADGTAVPGWGCTQLLMQPQGGTNYVFQGRSDGVQNAFKYIAETYAVDDATLSGITNGVATINASKAPVTPPPEGKPAVDKSAAESMMPDVTLKGVMLSAPVYQAPFFGLGPVTDPNVKNALSVQAVKMVDTILRDTGTVTERSLAGVDNDKTLKYAGWVMAGVKTYEVPSYQLDIVHHLYPDKAGSIADFIKDANKCFVWDDVVAKLPYQFRPPCPEGFAKWRALAPTIKMGKDEITVSLSYLGAARWPEFYANGGWEAPSIAYS